MRGQSVFEVQSDHVIMRTPNEPDYWHGNLVAVRVMGDPRQDLACFMEAFPDASHVTVVWDVPGLDPEPLRTALPELEIGTFDVLTLQGAIGDAALPLGINLQPVNDWDGLLDLQLEAASEVGYDPAAHKHYLQRRNASLRAQIAAGNGQCFGAYDGDFIVGTMGIFHDDRIARYQSVITRASYRRRGICAALLVHSRNWVHLQAPHAIPVIVAEADSAVGRLYRRMGFALTETLVDATKPGY